MSSLLSSTLSGQLNNLLSQALNMNNWNISSNLSTGQEGWKNLEVEGILSGRLLNNRLIINGNFGYRENEMRNSNFIGDFNAQLRLNATGDFALKAYNMTNDRYFAKQTFNTQGVGLIYKREFDNWRDFFKRKASFGVEKLTENFNTLVGAVIKAKPAAAKGQYIKSCVVASTMGPGVKINQSKLGN